MYNRNAWMLYTIDQVVELQEWVNDIGLRLERLRALSLLEILTTPGGQIKYFFGKRYAYQRMQFWSQYSPDLHTRQLSFYQLIHRSHSFVTQVTVGESQCALVFLDDAICMKVLHNDVSGYGEVASLLSHALFEGYHMRYSASLPHYLFMELIPVIDHVRMWEQLGLIHSDDPQAMWEQYYALALPEYISFRYHGVTSNDLSYFAHKWAYLWLEFCRHVGPRFSTEEFTMLQEILYNGTDVQRVDLVMTMIPEIIHDTPTLPQHLYLLVEHEPLAELRDQMIAEMMS